VHARLDPGGHDVTIVTAADTVPAVSGTVHLRLRRDRLHLFLTDGSRVAVS
jgi:hypothetical protein